jgi:hypothetical protein
MRRCLRSWVQSVSVVIVVLTLLSVSLGSSPGVASGAEARAAFSNTPLIATWSPPRGLSTSPIPNSTGNSEPAIAFGADGTMAVDGLGWLPYQVNMWIGAFGAAPAYFGAMDTNLQGKGQGRTTLGDEDADVDITSAGTVVLADLNIVINHHFNNAQLGLDVTRCPAGASGPADCTTSFLDTAGADRPWITHLGTSVWVAYHDAKNSSIIRVKKSIDDGRTWKSSGSPLTGLGHITGGATYNNSLGPIVADPTTGYVYESFASGEPQTKCCSGDYNNIFVSRSTDGGAHYTATLVYHAPPFTRLNNFWPSLAVDPANGTLWTAWTDQHGVWVSSSRNHGSTWTAPALVSNIKTTVMPWVAAMGGKVDVVYYGTTAASVQNRSAVWNVYDSQQVDGAWAVKLVSNTPNRIGAVCMEGSACEGNVNRELLDLFEVAEDPGTGRAAIIYTDTTMNTWTQGHVTKELPEIVLAFEK